MVSSGGRAVCVPFFVGILLYLIGFPKWTTVLFSFTIFLWMGGLQYLKLVYLTLPRDLRYYGGFLTLWKKVDELKNLYVSDVFHQYALKYPNKVAILFEDRKVTFKELDDLSNKIANMLRTTTGLKRGDCMALFMENCPEFLAVYMALSKIGVIAAFINCNLRAKGLAHCIQIGRCSGIFFSSVLSEAVSEVLPKLDLSMSQMLYSVDGDSDISEARILEAEVETASPDNPPLLPDKLSHDLACYIYTSGTTGLPKACNISHFQFSIGGIAIGHMMKIVPEDIVYVTLPLYHTSGCIIGAGQMINYGATLMLRKKFSASNFCDDCIKYNCTVFIYIGEVCRYLLAQPKLSDTKLPIRVFLGNGLRPSIWSSLQKRFQIPMIVEIYGATDARFFFANLSNKVGALGFMSRIFPFLNKAALVKIDPETGEYLRDSRGFCVQAGVNEPGEVIGIITEKISPSKYSIYTNPDASEKKVMNNVFVKGDKYFLSGDILRMDEEGFLYFCDRIGDTFRWKGENVSTTEVESVMANILQLRNVVVYGVEVPGNEGRAGMAAIEGTKDSVNLSGLAQQLFLSLPAYAVPLFIRIIPSAELTGTFKLKKVKLRNEGFDITLPDPLFMMDASRKAYQPLTEELYQQIQNKKLRI